MGKGFLVLGLGLLFTAEGIRAEVPFTLQAAAQEALAVIAKELKAGGVQTFDPYDPRLPYPQVSAIEALVNTKSGAFSYYDIEYGAGNNYVFKNRQGGNRFTINSSTEHIQFSTYYAGNVAHANRFKTVAGWGYNFWCDGSFQVTKVEWDVCVSRRFIIPLRALMTGK